MSYFTNDSAGEYKCIAENIYGETTTETFFVSPEQSSMEPPTIRIEPKVLEVIEGADIIVNFTFTVKEFIFT